MRVAGTPVEISKIVWGPHPLRGFGGFGGGFPLALTGPASGEPAAQTGPIVGQVLVWSGSAFRIKWRIRDWSIAWRRSPDNGRAFLESSDENKSRPIRTGSNDGLRYALRQMAETLPNPCFVIVPAIYFLAHSSAAHFERAASDHSTPYRVL